MKSFSHSVIQWYLLHKRNLPWREISDPYKIWVSEIILQQTRISQGLDYYLRFLSQFPTVQSLASASEDDVLRQWQGLGYYSRARNMHTAAKEITERFNGVFPNNYKDIRSLKGIGDYTAAAIASFAFGLPHAVLDGNVFRVLSRFFEIAIPIDSVQGKKEFAELAQSLLDLNNPALYNQGIMDLGAVICLPSSPKCVDCPLQDACLALAHNTQKIYPVKGKKIHLRDRYFAYFVVKDSDKHYFLHKRTDKDIWQGLYEFPLVELSRPLDEYTDYTEIVNALLPSFPQLTIQKINAPIKHILSHQCIYAWFIEAKADVHKNTSLVQYNMVDEQDLDNYAVSRLTEIYLDQRM